MLDFLLSRSFLDASGVRRAGTVRADAGIPILPVFIFRLQTVAGRQPTCTIRDSEIPRRMPPLKHLRHRIETSEAPLATPWMAARNSRDCHLGAPQPAIPRHRDRRILRTCRLKTTSAWHRQQRAGQGMQAGRNPSLIEAGQSLDPGRPSFLTSRHGRSLFRQEEIQRLLYRAKRPLHIALNLRKFGVQHRPPRMKNHVDVGGQFRLRLPDCLPHAPLDAVAIDRVPQHLASRQANPGSCRNFNRVAAGWCPRTPEQRLHPAACEPQKNTSSAAATAVFPRDRRVDNRRVCAAWNPVALRRRACGLELKMGLASLTAGHSGSKVVLSPRGEAGVGLTDFLNIG